MTEQEQAKMIAESWLDFRMNSLTQMVPGDPDCDACVLARQYIRALDAITVLTDFARNVAGLDDRLLQNTAILKQWRDDARKIVSIGP